MHTIAIASWFSVWPYSLSTAGLVYDLSTDGGNAIQLWAHLSFLGLQLS